MAALNEFDLAFVVDTTGSMGELIAAAQRQMVAMVDRLARGAAIDTRLGVVEYRDHYPQDTLVRRVYPFTGDRQLATQTIQSLRAEGGGDEPEAVFAGLVAAAGELAWRPHARRIAVLVGDAPPHGQGQANDHWREACPSGETIHSTSAKLEAQGIRLFALGLRAGVAASFGDLSRLTGGEYFAAGQGEAAIEQLQAILQREFGDLDFDRAVHGLWTARESPDYRGVAEALQATEARVVASVARLATRGLFDREEVAADASPEVPPGGSQLGWFEKIRRWVGETS